MCSGPCFRRFSSNMPLTIFYTFYDEDNTCNILQFLTRMMIFEHNLIRVFVVFGWDWRGFGRCSLVLDSLQEPPCGLFGSLCRGIFELNFYGTYHCMKAELEIMTQQKFGSIAAQVGPATFWHVGASSAWERINIKDGGTHTCFNMHHVSRNFKRLIFPGVIAQYNI